MNIKFKAWDKKTMQFAQVEMIDFCHELVWLNGLLIDQAVVNTSRKFDEVVLMRFTGMQDKEGQDIFEGDIVRYAGRDLIVCFGYYDYYDDIEECNVVGYGFYIKFVKTGNVRDFLELMDTYTEKTTLVVGNVHQMDEYEKSNANDKLKN